MRQIVDSTQINQWFVSTRRDAQEMLPHLVRKLIAATVEPQALLSLKVPAGDDVGRAGYDGQVETVTGNAYVPTGVSVWEMGTGDPEQKAEEDYAKRTRDPRGVDPEATTFIFVSPHPWDGKEKWASEKNSEGMWKKIRVLESSDLAAWLEMAPGVALWLAHQMGIPVEGIRDIELYLGEAVPPCAILISPDLLIGGRDEDLRKLHEWLDSDKAQITVEGESVEEASAFIAAALSKLHPDKTEKVAPRVLFVDQPAAMDYVSGLRATLFVVPVTVDAVRRANALRTSSIRLIVPCVRSAGRPPGEKPDIKLGSVRRRSCEEALKAAGLPTQRAEKVAQECKGSLTALLWMISGSQGTVLPWTTGRAASDLAPLVLAGQWVPGTEGDRVAVAELCGRNYNDVERTVISWAAPAGPLVRRSAIWDWLAWDFAWGCMAPSMDRGLIDRFRTVAMKVLGEPDPRFGLPPDQRWAAPIHGKVHSYSSALRSGLVGSIVQMALHDQDLPGISGQSAADGLVRHLLGGEYLPRKSAWLSLAPWLPDLAEASPTAFLQALDDWLQDREAVSAIFEEEGLFGGSTHTHLLWALERLAWSKELLTRVTLLLGKMAEADPGGHLANRPSASLKTIFTPWLPQTTANAQHRLDAIDVLYQQCPAVAWQLVVSLLPKGYDVSMQTAAPRWRQWKPTDEQRVTVADYWRFVEGVVDRLLKWVGTGGEQWKPLIEAYFRLLRAHPELAGQLLESLRQLETDKMQEADRKVICDTLRAVLTMHAEADEDDEDGDKEDTKPLAEIYERFRPTDIIERNRWLFASWPELPGRRKMKFEEQQQRIEEERLKVVKEIYNSQGIKGTLELAKRVERPDAVGFILAKLDLEEGAEADLLQQTLREEPTKQGLPAALSLGLGYVCGTYHRRGGKWLDNVLGRGGVPWDSNMYANLALWLSEEGPLWDRLEQWGTDAAKLYWSRKTFYFLPNLERDGVRAVRNLLAADRPFGALNLISASLHQNSRQEDPKQPFVFPKELVLEVLAEASKNDPRAELPRPPLDSLGYHVAEILDVLEEEGVDDATLAGIEWVWLTGLEDTKRGSKALQRALSDDPRLFVDVLKILFRGENEEPRQASDEERAKATQCFRLLHVWKRVPGTVHDEPAQDKSEGDIVFGRGQVDQGKLFAWVDEARRLATECGRLGVCDSHIGEVLAHAPEDADGRWPCEPVRNLLEKLASKKIENGFAVGIYNMRGVFCRAEGGDQERNLAAKFRRSAELIQTRWPRTASVLHSVAEGYEREGHQEDDRAAFNEFE
jgi:hypothetical protein